MRSTETEEATGRREERGRRRERVVHPGFSPSPRHHAPPPPYLYANELHFAILMFQPSRPGPARKGAQDTRKRVRPPPYMFTTVVFTSATRDLLR